MPVRAGGVLPSNWQGTVTLLDFSVPLITCITEWFEIYFALQCRQAVNKAHTPLAHMLLTLSNPLLDEEMQFWQRNSNPSGINKQHNLFKFQKLVKWLLKSQKINWGREEGSTGLQTYWRTDVHLTLRCTWGQTSRLQEDSHPRFKRIHIHTSRL